MRTFDLPIHPSLLDPITGEPIRALGVTKRGKLIWPVMGGSQPSGEPAPTNAPPPSAPAPAAVPPAPTPTPPAPAQQPAAQPPAQQQPATGTPPAEGSRPNAIGANGEDLGYPVNTPLSEMATGQREAYWRHKARVHEDRVKGMSDYDVLKQRAEQYDALLATTQTEQERALQEAEQRGRTSGLVSAGEQVVEALFRAHANNRTSEDSVNALLENLDRRRFINDQTGAVDADRVRQLVETILPAPVAPAATAAAAAPQAGAPAPGQPTLPQPGVPGSAVPAAGIPTPSYVPPAGGPDMGQGRPTAAGPTGLEAGRAIARQRFAKQQPQATTATAAQ